LLASIRCGEQTSLESAFCRRCEHRYFRKLPGQNWYQQYYANEWDAGRIGVGGRLGKAKRVVGRLPLVRALWNLAHHGSASPWNGRTRQLFAMLPSLSTRTKKAGGDTGIRKVLEIGCGLGNALEVFQRMGVQAYGTEASPHRARECRRRHLKVVDCPVDTLEPVERFAPFDLVYSTHVLEHLVDPARHLAAMAALVRPEGFLYLQVPHATLGELLVPQAHYAGHCHSFSPRSLCLLLAKVGLSPVRMHLDHNIQVLARMQTPGQSDLVHTQTVNPDDYLEPFRRVIQGTEQRFRLAGGPDYCRLTEDGKPVYVRSSRFSAGPKPDAYVLEFIARTGREGVVFPVRFTYAGCTPPVWIKRS